jgi:hypothetical protein
MNIEFDNELLYISCSGAQFSEQLESCRSLGMRYDADKKAWFISPGFLDKVMEEMKIYNLSISEYDRLKIKEYFEHLSEIKKITKRSEYRKFHPELLNIEPLTQEMSNGAINEGN